MVISYWRIQNMNCPNCKIEMEEGEMLSHGISVWRKKEIRKPGFFSNYQKFILGGKCFVVAYKCPKCGKIELYGEIK